MVANLTKVFQNALRAIPSSGFDPQAENELNLHLALGSQVLLAFQKLAQSQVGVLSPFQQLEAILAIVAKTFRFPLVFVEQHNPETEQLKLIAAHGMIVPSTVDPVSDYAQTLSGTVIATQKPMIWSEALDPIPLTQLQGIELFADSFHTVVSLPLIHHQEVVGLLTLAHPDYQPIAGYVIHWLSSMAAPVAAILEEIQTAQRHHALEERLELAALGLRGLIYDLDLEQRQMLRTQGVISLLGYDETETTLSLAWWLNRVHPEDQLKLRSFLDEDVKNHREFALSYRVCRKNGQYLTVSDRGIVLRNALGEPIRMVGTIAEAPLLGQVEGPQIDSHPLAPLEDQTEAFAPIALAPPAPAPRLSLPADPQPSPSVLNHLQDVIFQTDLTGCWTFLNPAWTHLTGFSVPETIYKPWQDFIHPDDRDAQRQAFLSVVEQQPNSTHPQLRYLTQQGNVRWMEAHCQPLTDAEGLVIGTTGTLFDITDRKSVEAQLRHDVMHDSLTGLPNRVLFTNRLQHVYQNYQRHPEAGFAILFLDLDRFKIVNDSLGHIIGDELLRAVAERLRQCLRPGDTVARFGGDEFTVLLPNVTDVQDAVQVSERILSQLSQPFQLSNTEIYTSGSIGIALSLGPEQPFEELLRNADIALYRAKTNGKGRYELFVPTMYTDARQQHEFETDLRRAIEQHELVLYYQPIYSLRDRQLAGFEALLRWNHPKQGLLHPAAFLSLAEETGLIVPMGEWVLQTACQQLQSWQHRYVVTAGTFMSINLTRQQIEAEDFGQRVHQTLTDLSLPSHCLMLEISERAFAENREGMRAKLSLLQDLGVYLCLDEFGRRFSSFGDLGQLPLSHLKIDRSFIKDMQKGNNLEVVRSILKLGEQLGFRVIAEGIESEPQMAQLQGMKCNYGQGRFLGHASPVDDLIDILEQQGLADNSSMDISSTSPTLILATNTKDNHISLVGGRSWSLGRSPDSTAMLNDRWVSRNHAEIQLLDNGDYYLVDLGSGNGSFVNGQRVTMPVRLKDGDLLTIGRTEIEFQFLVSEVPTELQEGQPQTLQLQSTLPKTVLMVQVSARQADIWKAALKSQEIALTTLGAEVDLQQVIEQRAQARESLPDLLLLDMTTLRPNAYSFCRWCHEKYPQLKIVLTSGTRTEVPPSERQWAIHQGAVDLLSAFPAENLFSKLVDIVIKVRAVLHTLDTHPMSQQSLASALMSIQSVVNPKSTLIGSDDRLDN